MPLGTSLLARGCREQPGALSPPSPPRGGSKTELTYCMRVSLKPERPPVPTTEESPHISPPPPSSFNTCCSSCLLFLG